MLSKPTKDRIKQVDTIYDLFLENDIGKQFSTRIYNSLDRAGLCRLQDIKKHIESTYIKWNDGSTRRTNLPGIWKNGEKVLMEIYRVLKYDS